MFVFMKRKCLAPATDGTPSGGVDVAAIAAQVTEQVQRALMADRNPAGGVGRELGQPAAPAPTEGLVAVEENDKVKGLKFARFLRSHAMAIKDHRQPEEVARDIAKSDRRYGAVAKHFELVRTKSLTSNALASGGAFVSEVYGDLIDALRAESVVRGNVPSIDMSGGNLTLGRLESGPTAAYTTEGAQVNAFSGAGATGEVKLSAKKLQCIVPISNDLLRRSVAGGEMLIRNDAIARMNLRGDLAFLRGTGESGTPRGMTSFATAAHTFTATGTDIDACVADVLHAQRLLKTANVPTRAQRLFISPRTEAGWKGLRDGVGGFPFLQSMIASGTFMGIPYSVSSQLPENLGGGGTSAEIILVECSEALIGDTMALEVTSSDGAAYHNSSGTLVSGFDTDETVVRLISEHDFTMRHAASVVLIEGVTVGS